MNARAALLLGCALSCACERPWDLMETGSLEDTFVAIHASAQEVVLGGHKGRFVRRAQGSSAVEEVRALDDRGQSVSGNPVLGMVPGPDGDLYAWTADALLRRTTANFAAVAAPVDQNNRPLARVWNVLSAVEHAGQMLVATRVGDGPGAVLLLLEGSATAGWRRAVFDDATEHPITWLARAPDGTAWAGDGRAASRSLYTRVGNVWSARGRLAVADTEEAVVAGGRLFQRNATGVRAEALDAPGAILGELSLRGTFTDLCALSDGRVAVVGPARMPLSSLWVLTGGRWANVNTGTREDLLAVACGPGDRLAAAGQNGMAVVEAD